MMNWCRMLEFEFEGESSETMVECAVSARDLCLKIGSLIRKLSDS